MEPDYYRGVTVSNLAFEIKPPPGSAESPRIAADTMLREIDEMRQRYEDSPAKAKEYCKKAFGPVMAVEFVFNSNKGESVGTQTCDGTLELLQPFLNESDDAEVRAALTEPIGRKEKESVNTLKALKESFFSWRSDKKDTGMKDTGYLTPHLICDLHRILIEDVPYENVPKPGKIRTNTVFTTYRGEFHTYPPPDGLEKELYRITDHHCIMMQQVLHSASKLEITLIFKCAAWLLIQFVNLHPFSDGNGRLCRLLANYVLSFITPFPVSVYHTGIAGRSRDDYLNAIVNCREQPEHGGPCEIAYLLVEGAYRGWKKLFHNFKTYNLLTEERTLSLVIRMSDERKLQEIVTRFISTNPDLESNKDKVLGIVRETVESMDVNTTLVAGRPPAAGQYMAKTLKLNSDTVLQLEIYPPEL